MAKERIIKVTDSASGEEILVTASNGKKAVAFVIADRFTAEVASAEDVTRLVNEGHKVHRAENPTHAPTEPELPPNLHVHAVQTEGQGESHAAAAEGLTLA